VSDKVEAVIAGARSTTRQVHSGVLDRLSFDISALSARSIGVA